MEVVACFYFVSRLEVVNRAYLLCKEYLQGAWADVPLHDFQLTPLG